MRVALVYLYDAALAKSTKNTIMCEHLKTLDGHSRVLSMEELNHQNGPLLHHGKAPSHQVSPPKGAAEVFPIILSY